MGLENGAPVPLGFCTGCEPTPPRDPKEGAWLNG